MNSFEVNVARRAKHAKSKLVYLIQHCTGKAKEVTKNCSVISDAEKGYERAQEILYHRFGQKDATAHAHISRLVRGPQLNRQTLLACLTYLCKCRVVH